MLLGQLYYYTKKLDDLDAFIQSGNINNLEILGVDNSSLVQLDSAKDRLEVIKNSFILNYQAILDENNFKFATSFWTKLTSFQESPSQKLEPKSDFQQHICHIEDLSIEIIDELIAEASMGDNEEDYAIAYGIKVLGAVNQIDPVQLEPIEVESRSNLIQSPEIIVISQSQYKPLFVNINCLFMDNQGSLSEITEKVEGLIEQHHTVKLILIDNQYQNTLNHLQRFLSGDVLISSMDLTPESSSGYFDQIVKETLGIRLV